MNMTMRLIREIDIWRYWGQRYVNAAYALKPEKGIMNEYGQSDILAFKMVASLALELMLKSYCLALFNASNREFSSSDELLIFLKKEVKIYTHDLSKLLDKVRKGDSGFSSDFEGQHLENAVSAFNCFEQARYPRSKQSCAGLFIYDEGLFNDFLYATDYLFHRTRAYSDKHTPCLEEPTCTEENEEADMCEPQEPDYRFE
jgi:HEPN domain-containing protein